MNTLSENIKQKIFIALNGKQSGVFVVDGHLDSIAVEVDEINNDR